MPLIRVVWISKYRHWLHMFPVLLHHYFTTRRINQTDHSCPVTQISDYLVLTQQIVMEHPFTSENLDVIVLTHGIYSFGVFLLI